MSDALIVESSHEAIIEAPIDQIDVSEWLFNLSDAEYQRCAIGHIAAGRGVSADGKPMSLNVEQVSDFLMVQHYVGEVVEKHHCRLVSTSDLFVSAGRTTMTVVWEMTVSERDDGACTFTNRFLCRTTDDMEAFLVKGGVPLDVLRGHAQGPAIAHNAEETPNFAKSIERKALGQTNIA